MVSQVRFYMLSVLCRNTADGGQCWCRCCSPSAGADAVVPAPDPPMLLPMLGGQCWLSIPCMCYLGLGRGVYKCYCY